MRTDVSAVLRVLELALGVEQAGREFYEKAVVRTKSRGGQRVYRSLIEEEKEHYRILMNEYNSLRGGGGWVPLSIAQQTPVEIALFPVGKAAELVLKDGATDVEALKLAMDFEQRGYEMYRKAAEQSRELDAQAVCAFLATRENEHFALLQRTHDYLVTQGAWMYDDMEKPHLD